MTGAASLAFPGSRTLANWWRQLAPYEPVALWVGYLFLHRVEANVDLLEHESLDRAAHLLLQAVDLEWRGAHAPAAYDRNGADPGINDSGRSTCEALERRLRLDAPLIRQLLVGLADKGLLHDNGSQWRLTDLGRLAAAEGSFPRQRCERRIFTFVERRNVSGMRAAPPHFLAFAAATGVDWDAVTQGPFDPELLRRCPYQPDDWKRRYGFPLEVKAVHGQSSADDWKNVVFDRPERVLAALVIGGPTSAEKRLLGFLARPDGWVLESREAIVNLPASARDALIDLAGDAGVVEWRKAWQAWCQIRQLPSSEVGACRIIAQGAGLRVSAPARLIQRLREARSDIFKGEAWLLAGEGYIRQSACLELVPL